MEKSIGKTKSKKLGSKPRESDAIRTKRQEKRDTRKEFIEACKGNDPEKKKEMLDKLVKAQINLRKVIESEMNEEVRTKSEKLIK